jgi:probable addiction module antidote protein
MVKGKRIANAHTDKPSKMKTSAYDVATHLRSPEEMTAYLEAWREEAPDDAAGIARALGDIARARNIGRVTSEANLSRDNLRS